MVISFFFKFSLHYMKHYLALNTQVKTPVKKRNNQQTFNKLQKKKPMGHIVHLSTSSHQLTSNMFIIPNNLV